MSTLYFGGHILTMDEKCPTVEALLVKQGKILKRGDFSTVYACRETDTVCIDLQGKTMLPGFIDGHSHFSGLATSLSQCDLSEAQNFDDIVRLLKKFIKDNKIAPGQWVTGTNYDHNFLTEQRHPDKFLLDSISTAHPIVICHASSHMGVVNSLALERQGLLKQPDPAGGHYGRVNETDELNGYMEENTFVAFRNAMPMPEIGEIMELYRRAQEIYASYGITTVQEGMVTAPLLQLLQYAEKNNILYLDLVGYLDLETLQKAPEQYPEYTDGYKNHFRIGGFKIFLDGSPQGRTAWMLEPYQGSPDYYGYPIKEDDELYGLILSALQKKQQLLTHCNGDAAAEQLITQFEKVLQEHPQLDSCRPVMIHAQLVRKQQLERMQRISMTPSFFTAHTYFWGDIHIQNFGMERAKDISPAASAVRIGLPFTFHQDSPVLPPNVLQTLWCAAKRVTKSGIELNPHECISIYDALKALTVYAAYQYGEENRKGTLEEGKLADLVILNQNPLTVSVDEVKDIHVMETIKEGRTVFKRLGD